MVLKHASHIELRLTVRPQAVSCFYPLLSRGFMIHALVGCSICDLLCDQLGIDENLVETHMQTVFLNGKVVDDLHQSIIEDGCALSLSSALPGMVGAAFRKSGFYAGLREAVSFRSKTPVSGLRPGRLRVKLFNLTGPTIGPFFLRYGIEITGTELEEVFQTCADTLSDGLRGVKINGKKSTSKGLRSLDLKHCSIRLFVEASMD
jgi:hypothetical protein